MGEYLIPGDLTRDDVTPCIRRAEEKGVDTAAMVWDWGVEGGILATHPTMTNEQIAAIYSGFDPDAYRVDALPDNVRQAVAFLKTRAAAGDNMAKAVGTLLLYLNERLG